MEVTVKLDFGGDTLLWSTSGSVSYGTPSEDRCRIKNNAGTKFTPVEEGGKKAAYLDTIGNTPCPSIKVYHEFGKGSKPGPARHRRLAAEHGRSYKTGAVLHGTAERPAAPYREREPRLPPRHGRNGPADSAISGQSGGYADPGKQPGRKHPHGGDLPERDP